MIRTLAFRPVARLAIMAALALALTGLAVALAPNAQNHDTVSAASRVDRSRFHDAMRQLWEDHIVWTRMVIVSFAADLPDLNPRPSSDSFETRPTSVTPSSRTTAMPRANELTALLSDHIIGAADLLVGCEGSRQEPSQLTTGAWYANGEEIGDFLAAPIPSDWHQSEMQAMMGDHST